MQRKNYSASEEIISSVSHGIGAAISIAALVVGVVFAVLYSDVWAIVSMSIYGGTLIVMYSMSMLYHALTNDTVKGVFRILDHCSIFLLIAGTYTPFLLVTLRGPLGFSVFSIVWAIAILGIVISATPLKWKRIFSLICYLVMSWAIIALFPILKQQLGMNCINLLLSGGIVYTVGAAIYGLKKLKYMHALWHIFVVFGSVLHYFAILLYVIK